MTRARGRTALSVLATDILHLPLIYTSTGARNEFRLTIPYVSIHSEEPVTFAGGDITRRGSGEETTESGPGDVIVQGEHFFREGGPRRSWISGHLRVKLPTADEDRGLGTGEMDVGPGAAIRPAAACATRCGFRPGCRRSSCPGPRTVSSSSGASRCCRDARQSAI